MKFAILAPFLPLVLGRRHARAMRKVERMTTDADLFDLLRKDKDTESTRVVEKVKTNGKLKSDDEEKVKDDGKAKGVAKGKVEKGESDSGSTDAFNVNNFAQLSSTVTQPNGPLGVGTPIQNDSIDALMGIDFDPLNPFDVTIRQGGAYFALAAPQIAGTAFTREQLADYFMRLDGVNIGNSNVRYVSEGSHADVIITQGVLELNAGNVLQVIGSGVNSNTQVVAQVGEPLVPSIIFSLFELELPIYAQLSSTVDQPNGPLGTGVPITYNSVDALSGILFSPDDSNIIIQTPGTYFALAAPQVAGISTDVEDQTADYYFKINGQNVANSNVRFVASSGDQDVIITQGVVDLNAGDRVQIYGSGMNSVTKAISEPGEPLVPSIIFSIFQIAQNVYCQLSSTVTQRNGPLGTGVALTFDSIDAISPSGITFVPGTSEIIINTPGTYFALAAPQIGGVDEAQFEGEQVADYFFKINGANVGNSNVRYQDAAEHKDVIITQGVLSGLQAGDTIQIFASGVNSNTEAITEPGEPLVPSIIYSMFMI